MNNEQMLEQQFGIPNRLSWQTHKHKSIEVDEVIWDLLKKSFVVEIDGYKYDVTFGKNRKGEIGHSATFYPSPVLISSEFIRRAFREGVWYELLDERLSDEELADAQACRDSKIRQDHLYLIERLIQKASLQELSLIKAALIKDGGVDCQPLLEQIKIKEQLGLKEGSEI